MKRLLQLGLLAVATLMPLGVQAASEQITDFNSKVHLDRHNVVDITETIVYDFGDSEHHGIYRVVPTKYDVTGGKYYTDFKFLDASQDGHPVEESTNDDSDNSTMKLGDPNVTISGQHTYVLHYQLSPIVIAKNGKDFLDLDITGNQWQVPIAHASATFSFDGDAQLADVQCYAGTQGSTDRTCVISKDAPAVYSATNLASGEGLSVNGFLPAGYVDHYLKPGDRPLGATDYAVLAVIGVLLLAGFVVLWRWLRERRRKHRQTVVAQYESPEGLTPGELGTLADDRANMREITATLIDLAVRGYIRIEQTRPKKFLSKAKYKLVMVKALDQAVQSYETDLLDAIFAGQPERAVDDVDRSTMAVTVASVKADLKQRLTQRGYYGDIAQEHGALAKLLDSGNITEAGAKVWAEVEGFKLYLTVAERDRLNFTDAPERTPERFNKLLPYAVALGVEKQWAKQFEGIDVYQGQNWYVSSYGAWTAWSIADDMGGSFASVAGASFADPSSASGGGAGGGFGGGGGGSW